MSMTVAQAVEELQGLQGSVCSQFAGEIAHLIAVGQGLSNATPAQISAYAGAVQDAANIVGSGDTDLQDELEGIGTSLVLAINNANPVSYVTPGNPNFIPSPYDPQTTDPLGTDGTTPGYIHPPPGSGIYWTGLLILAGCVAGAVVISKVRK
jgi:hypothetical protein